VDADVDADLGARSGGAAAPGPLVVLGAGGLGRETAVWARRAGHDVLGFLDREPASHGTMVGDLPILGDLDWLERASDDVACVVAVGAPRARRDLAARVRALGHLLATVVDPTAVLGDRVKLGTGTIVCAGATVTCDVVVGDGVVLSVGCAVHHDDVVGDHAFVGPGAQLSGNVTIGAGAWIGVGASIVQGVTVGAGTVVGAGAVVAADLPPDVTAVGVPARVASQHEQSW
jgi:sugar O-acyltransferase (sialic acid O-acetyltransferase NeuD family)